jgi:hypothetical protein
VFSSPEENYKPVVEAEMGEEIEGAIEYSVGVWTRWLTTYPKRLIEK